VLLFLTLHTLMKSKFMLAGYTNITLQYGIDIFYSATSRIGNKLKSFIKTKSGINRYYF